ncbi:MAG: tetratricopeptide repeat protein [Limisphaerales bacterium]
MKTDLLFEPDSCQMLGPCFEVYREKGTPRPACLRAVQLLLTAITVGLLLCLTAGCSAKARAERHLKRADKYFDAGQYAGAEVEYLVALQRQPANAHALARLGTVYYEEGRLGRAFAPLTNACALIPNDPDLRLKVASIYLAIGKIEEAREQVNFVLDQMPTNSEAPVLLVECAASRTNLDDARQRLEKLSQQVGDTAPVQLAFGTLHLRGGDLKAAETAFKRALTLDPKSSAAFFGLGTLRWAQNDLKGADSNLKTGADLAPPRSVRRLKYADFKIQTGNLAEGKRLLAEITKATPDYLPAWIRQADIALAEKKYEDCDGLLKQALARDPASYEALLLKGRVMLSQNQAAKAIAEFERMSKIYDRSPQVHYQLALAHLLGNDPAKASQSLNQALLLQPDFDDAILLQARINIAREEIDSAISALTELLQRQPKLPQAHLELAAAYRAKGDLEAALATYRRLGEIYPKNPETPLLSGLVYLQQNQKEEARKAFARTLELAPSSLQALECLVDLDIMDQQFPAALERVQKALEQDPKSAGLQLLLAKIFAAQKKIDQAEAALLKVIASDPNRPGAYMILARLYVENKQNDKALEELDQVLSATPADTTALTLKATIQDELKDFTAARATYEKLLAIRPDSYLALNNLAYLYAERFGMLDQAYEMARKARDMATYKPNRGTGAAESAAGQSAEYLKAFSADTLGWVVFKRGEYPYALSLFQESAAQLGAQPEVQFHLGLAYYMLGQEENARIALIRALAPNQEHPDKEFSGKDEAARRLAILAIDPKSDDPKVLADLEQRLQKDPGDPVVLARVAAIYERTKATEKMVKAYESALKNNPNNIPALIKLARLYSGPLHDSKRALELAKEAYKLAPEDPEISCALGRLVFEAGDDKWALSLLQQGCARLSPTPEILYDLALAYYSVGRVSEAEAAMRNALQSRAPFARTNDARQFLDLVPLAASPAKALPAEPEVQEILKANPDDVPALMVAAVCAEQRGQVQAARQACERALNRYPEFSPAAKKLAVIYTETGDDQKAYDLATKARAALPDDPEVAKTLGIALYRRGDYRNSARLLNEGLQKAGDDGPAWYYLGMTHYQLKEPKEKTRDTLQRALALNLQPKFADDARRILAQLK